MVHIKFTSTKILLSELSRKNIFRDNKRKNERKKAIWLKNSCQSRETRHLGHKKHISHAAKRWLFQAFILFHAFLKAALSFPGYACGECMHFEDQRYLLQGSFPWTKVIKSWNCVCKRTLICSPLGFKEAFRGPHVVCQLCIYVRPFIMFKIRQYYKITNFLSNLSRILPLKHLNMRLRESILPNFNFFIFPIFTFKLGHFKVQTIFSYATNTQA